MEQSDRSTTETGNEIQQHTVVILNSATNNTPGYGNMHNNVETTASGSGEIRNCSSQATSIDAPDDVPSYSSTADHQVIESNSNIPHGRRSTHNSPIEIPENITQPPNPIPVLHLHTSTSSGNTSTSVDMISPPKVDYYAPPPYDVVTDMAKLPTYEEVEREKRMENEEFSIPINAPSATIVPPYVPPGQRILTIENDSSEDIDTSLLGTDFMFCIAFFVAFVFNWIGFLLLMCFCHTIASRYGALSGFGLSLAKWTFIVQHSTELASKDNGWLWWLIMTFGLVVCIRALLQYLNIKRSWPLLSASHKERLLFFY